MPRIVVVGAGVSGLAVAFRLQHRLPSADIVVLEQQSRPGGTIQTHQRDGFLVEGGPNGFPDSNPSTLTLARELDLRDQLVAASESAARNRFLFLNSRLRLLPHSFRSFLTSDLLSWVAKARLLGERFRPAGRTRADESIDAFARRRVGNEIARTFVDAFVTGILAGDAKLLSVNAAFPRLVAWEREHGSVSAGMAHVRRERRLAEGATQRAGKMWSFQRGLGSLVAALASRLRQPALTGVTVRRIVRDRDEWVVHADGNDLWRADAVVLACPAYRQAEALDQLDEKLASRIGSVPYNRVAVVALGFRREDMPHPLDGFGYLSPQSDRRDVLGVQWCSSIYPGRAPEGAVLLRAMCGGWNRPEIVDWPDDRLVAAVRAELARTLGVRVAPYFVHLVRWPRAIPQYHVGHLDRVSWIEQRLTQHPGLFAGGNSYRGVAINDCVEQASLLAESISTWCAGCAKA